MASYGEGKASFGLVDFHVTGAKGTSIGATGSSEVVAIVLLLSWGGVSRLPEKVRKTALI